MEKSSARLGNDGRRACGKPGPHCMRSAGERALTSKVEGFGQSWSAQQFGSPSAPQRSHSIICLAIFATLTLTGLLTRPTRPFPDRFLRCKPCTGMNGITFTTVSLKETYKAPFLPKFSVKLHYDRFRWKFHSNKFCRTGSTRPTATETRVSNWSVYGTSHGSFGINQIQTIQTATFGRFSSEFIFPVFWRV
jgi:hypothetical protein